MSTDESTVDQLGVDHPELARAFQAVSEGHANAVRRAVCDGERTYQQRRALANLLIEVEVWSGSPPGVRDMACERIHSAYLALLRTVPRGGDL